jgi:hypothetical protein
LPEKASRRKGSLPLQTFVSVSWNGNYFLSLCINAKRRHAARVFRWHEAAQVKTPLGQAAKKGPSTDGPAKNDER